MEREPQQQTDDDDETPDPISEVGLEDPDAAVPKGDTLPAGGAEDIEGDEQAFGA